LVSGRRPVIRHSATSPGASTTAPGVPVLTMSPRSSGMIWLMKASRAAGLNRISATGAVRARLPFRQVETWIAASGSSSSSETMSGP
jgi:hypothetical protein